VVLDLHMPAMDGFEVLHRIRGDAHENVRRTPVIILTDSPSPADVEQAFDLGANAFVRKAVNLDQFREIVSAIEAFWIRVSTLP